MVEYTDDGALVLSGHAERVTSVAFSPNGRLVASGSADRTIQVWDLQLNQLFARKLEGHLGAIDSIAFSPKGTLIASGSRDYTIRLWNAYSGDKVASPFLGHTDWVWSVAFSLDSTRIASGSRDCSVRVWNTSTGEIEADPFWGHSQPVFSVAFSTDGTRIVSGSRDHTIIVWDAHSGAILVGPFRGHTDWVWSVVYSFDGACIASGSRDRTIRLWDATSGIPLMEPLEGHSGTVSLVDISINGNFILSGSANQAIYLWDIRTKSITEVLSHEEPSGVMSSIAVSLDCNRIAFGYDSGSVIVRTTFELDSNTPAVAAPQDKNHPILVVPKCDSPTTEEVISSQLSSTDMFERLVAHGCTDFSLNMDSTKYSSRPISGGGIGDIWKRRLLDGTPVAIKVWRPNSLIQDSPNCKQLKVHGDLKAVNILVSHDGVAKLSDFDHSILSGCTLVFTETTNMGGGTLRWMAPELLLSSDDNGGLLARRSKRTDIYALGMTFLEIITSQVPYAEYKQEHGVYRALDKKTPPLRPKQLDGVSERAKSMWKLLLRCWDHNPATRPKACKVLRVIQELNIRV